MCIDMQIYLCAQAAAAEPEQAAQTNCPETTLAEQEKVSAQKAAANIFSNNM